MDNKLKCLCLLAIMLAIVGIEFPLSTTIGVKYQLNTTNLAPQFPGETFGTGERVADNTTYWANDTDVYISVWAHANTVGQNSQIKLYINNTLYQNQAGKPVSVAEENNKSVFHVIPRGSFYSVFASNYHHYEWRETKVLTGNVSITQFNITNHSLLSNLQGGVPANDEFFHLNKSHYDAMEALTDCSSTPDNFYPLSWNGLIFTCLTIPKHDIEKVNKSGDTMTGVLDSNSNITTSAKILITDGTNGNQVDTTTSSVSDTFRTEKNTSQVWRMITAGGSGNFGSGRANGNLVSPTAVLNGDTLFSFFASGFDGSTYSSKNARVQFSADGNFNTTYHPTRIDLYTTNGSSDTLGVSMSIKNTGMVQINNLSGTGNAYVCVNSTGYLYRGSPGC